MNTRALLKVSRRRRALLRAALAAAVPLSWAGAARAATFPNGKPVTILCAYQPGGIVDVTSRRLAQPLSAAWGVPVIVDNRPGAGGNLAAGMTANATPDGNTILITLYEGLVISAAGKLKLSFDPIRDLTPVALLGDVELWLLAPMNAPYKTLSEFVDYVRKNPGKINMGSIGVGSAHHLGLLQMNTQIGAALTHVPYKGVSMVTDLIAGNIDVAFSSRLSTAGHVKDGKLRLLGVTGNRKSPLYPDVATFAEAGLGDVIVPYALGAFVSAKTPTDAVQRLNADLVKVLNEPAMKERFASEGVFVGQLTPQDFQARVQREVTSIGDVIARHNVTLSQ
jgi:tripartite-type tricarboxylate transporter receptor subunit TctC